MKNLHLLSFIAMIFPAFAMANYCETHFPESQTACRKSLESDKGTVISGNWLIKNQSGGDVVHQPIAINWSGYHNVKSYNGEVPSISLWCDGDTPQVSLFTATGMNSEVEVTYVFGSNPSVTEKWDANVKYASPIGDSEFASRLFDDEKLVIMTDSIIEAPLAFRFDLHGIGGVAEQLECLTGR